jgi:1-acyl-sn-glycerol-3-phosphate acyltransferase
MGEMAEPRQRCGRQTQAGRVCRNYARPGELCLVHGGPRTAAALAETRSRRAADGAAEGAGDTVAETLAFLRRRLTGDYHVDPFGFDRELTEFVFPLLEPLYSKWWRVRSLGTEHVPDDGAALLVGNHAGTLAAFDAGMVKYAVFREHPQRRHVRLLAADLVIRTPGIGHLGRKTGNTLAIDSDALWLLEHGELVGVWPEGFKGIGKPYRDRYKLQRFGRGGFIEVALRTGAPIIPVAIIGAEEIYPMIGNSKTLARVLGLPYFPITPTLPWLGPLGLIPLPTKWLIEFGEPIDLSRFGPEAADDPALVIELTDEVRDTIQQMLYRNLIGRRSIFF